MSWDEYIQIVSDPIYEKAKCYYHQGQLRIEMTPVGYAHAANNLIVSFAVNLYGILKSIPLIGLTNCSFRKQGIRECQPDVSYYLGKNAQVIPNKTKVVNLNQYPPPDLVIEVGDTSLEDRFRTQAEVIRTVADIRVLGGRCGKS